MRTRLVLFLTLLLILPAFAAPASSAIATTPSLPAADETGNYVIIIPDSSFDAAVAPLKTWKQLFGYTVRVVTLDTIYGLYTGDNAERIWQFLHDRYPPDVWGIRYVLLVGDVDRMPIRMLYPDGNAGDGSAYASDFYYANLSMANWDVDGDNRWGEFTHDHLDQDFHAEVIVGRIPLSDPRLVQDVSNHIVAFEKDIGGWKRNVLLAHGIMDYGDAVDPAIADIATLAERLKTRLLHTLRLDPNDALRERRHLPFARGRQPAPVADDFREQLRRQRPGGHQRCGSWQSGWERNGQPGVGPRFQRQRRC